MARPGAWGIQLINLFDAFPNAPLSLPDINDLITFRRCCWHYLEHRQLFFKHNIRALFNP